MGFLSVRGTFSPGYALPLVNASQIHLPESILHRSCEYSRASQRLTSFILRHHRATPEFALTGLCPFFREFIGQIRFRVFICTEDEATTIMDVFIEKNHPIYGYPQNFKDDERVLIQGSF